jgi:hypothetical protein
VPLRNRLTTLGVGRQATSRSPSVSWKTRPEVTIMMSFCSMSMICVTLPSTRRCSAVCLSTTSDRESTPAKILQRNV